MAGGLFPPTRLESLRFSRLDWQETYDTNFRAWHWRLDAEQLAFSQQLFAPGTQEPLYLKNNRRMLLLTGYDDACADLGKDTRDVASKMVRTPGYARFLKQTGHSLDNENPQWVAQQIADFLRESCFCADEKHIICTSESYLDERKPRLSNIQEIPGQEVDLNGNPARSQER